MDYKKIVKGSKDRDAFDPKKFLDLESDDEEYSASGNVTP